MRHATRCDFSTVSSRGAFTLVELLVVISIIALLISILLPSLKSAREQAKTVKCMAQQKGIATAAASYESEENDWIPGSPSTTGSIFYTNVNAAVDAVQNWDFMGPLAAVQMGMPFSGDRPTRFRQVTEGVFQCPANRLIALPFRPPAGQNFGPQRVVSYNTFRNFMLYPDDATTPIGNTGRYSNAAGQGGQIGGTTKLAKHYKPQVSLVGTPAEKVFISDSSRFIDSAGDLTYDSDALVCCGGAFSDGGPTLQSQPRGSADFLRAFKIDDPERKWTYRHPRGKTPGIAAAFFDTHVEYMTVERSRTPSFWWPKGTLLPAIELNAESRALVLDELRASGNNTYTVPR